MSSLREIFLFKFDFCVIFVHHVALVYLLLVSQRVIAPTSPSPNPDQTCAPFCFVQCCNSRLSQRGFSLGSSLAICTLLVHQECSHAFRETPSNIWASAPESKVLSSSWQLYLETLLNETRSDAISKHLSKTSPSQFHAHAFELSLKISFTFSRIYTKPQLQSHP